MPFLKKDLKIYVFFHAWCLHFMIVYCIITNVRERNTLEYFALPHNADYVVFLYYKTQSFDFTAMLYTGGHNIDTGSVDRTVPQDVSKLSNVLFDAVKSSSK